ncbi:MAG: amidohydrolase family protein [Gemmatimonadaceae bacterium]|jgi:imidazolonepropionase-like amidohydrolase|nr:amidohydrolase family protein [Gemmatimonadaceae bacterium]
MPFDQPPAPAAAVAPATPPRDTALVIDGATVIDVESGNRLTGARVVIRQRRIVDVGPAARVAMPTDALRIDGRGGFLIPGLWDMHVHSAYAGLGNLLLPLYIANGVTGVREMFGQLFAMKAYRAQIDTGALIGPRIVGSGHILDGPKPIWPGSVTARTPEQGMRAVDSLKAAGADFIKVYSVLPPDVYRAIATRAKAVGIPFAGHIPGGVNAMEASALGQHSAEHLTGIPLSCSRDEVAIRRMRDSVKADTDYPAAQALGRALGSRVIDTFDAEKCAAIYREFVANRTWQVPTMTVNYSISHLDQMTATDPRLAYIPKFLVQGWDPKTDFRLKALTPADWENSRKTWALNQRILREMVQAGVPILAGTDVLNPFCMPGFSLHDELRYLVEAGMTPLQALQAATVNPARFLAATDSLGTIARGKVADLVLLDADPLVEIGNTTKIRAVIAGGRAYDRTRLDAILAEAKARNAGN